MALKDNKLSKLWKDKIANLIVSNSNNLQAKCRLQKWKRRSNGDKHVLKHLEREHPLFASFWTDNDLQRCSLAARWGPKWGTKERNQREEPKRGTKEKNRRVESFYYWKIWRVGALKSRRTSGVKPKRAKKQLKWVELKRDRNQSSEFAKACRFNYRLIACIGLIAFIRAAWYSLSQTNPPGLQPIYANWRTKWLQQLIGRQLIAR